MLFPLGDRQRADGLDGDVNLRPQPNRAFERIRNEAGMFRLLERALCLLRIGTSRDRQVRVNLETRELRHAIDAIKRARHVTSKGRPGEPRRASDGSKRQDETVADGADQKCLGRPAITWSVEFGWRG
jgi:hypothetical protein